MSPRLMCVVAMAVRTHDRVLVGDFCTVWQDVADLRAGHICRDRVEGATNLLGSVGLANLASAAYPICEPLLVESLQRVGVANKADVGLRFVSLATGCAHLGRRASGRELLPLSEGVEADGEVGGDLAVAGAPGLAPAGGGGVSAFFFPLPFAPRLTGGALGQAHRRPEPASHEKVRADSRGGPWQISTLNLILKIGCGKASSY